MKKNHFRNCRLLAELSPAVICFAILCVTNFFSGTAWSICFWLVYGSLLGYLTIYLLSTLKLTGVHRLNDYFVVLKYPWCRWHFIFQSTHKRRTKGKTCKDIAHRVNEQTAAMLDNLKPNCIYLTCTHLTGINRLKRNPNIQITKELFDHSGSLKKIQRHLFNRKCSKTCFCAQMESCHLQKLIQQKRDFYFVKFTVLPKCPETLI